MTEAMSVNVLFKTLFSLSVNSSPEALLFRSAVAAATSVASSCVPLQTSCLNVTNLNLELAVKIYMVIGMKETYSGIHQNKEKNVLQ